MATSTATATTNATVTAIASAAGMAWQTIIPDLLEQGHDLEFNVTKEQVTAAAARWIVAVADTFAPPSLD